MKKSRLLGAVCACLTIVSISSNAAIVTYDESVNGDLIAGIWTANPPIATYIGTLDVGVNTVIGTLFVSENTPVPAVDFDSFKFTISPGQKITSFTMAIDTIEGGLTTTYSIVDANFPDDLSAYFNIGNLSPTDGNSVDILSLFGGTPLTDGNYYAVNTTHYHNFGVAGSIDYTWSIGVSAVPIPATVWLFSSGLVGLLGLARRKC